LKRGQGRKLPHRRKYLLLVCGFLRELLELHLDWIEEIERELAPKRRRPTGATRPGA
jgi:hypothetical protein